MKTPKIDTPGVTYAQK